MKKKIAAGILTAMLIVLNVFAFSAAAGDEKSETIISEPEVGTCYQSMGMCKRITYKCTPNRLEFLCRLFVCQTCKPEAEDAIVDL